MAFPPTRYRDTNSWLPYSSERIAPVPPTRLSDAHFYTMGPHLQLHHLDYVIFPRTDHILEPSTPRCRQIDAYVAALSSPPTSTEQSRWPY